MPVRQREKNDDMEICCRGMIAKKAMTIGLLLLVGGLMRLYSRSWPEVAIVIGALLILKGLMIKAKWKK